MTFLPSTFNLALSMLSKCLPFSFGPNAAVESKSVISSIYFYTCAGDSVCAVWLRSSDLQVTNPSWFVLYGHPALSGRPWGWILLRLLAKGGTDGIRVVVLQCSTSACTSHEQSPACASSEDIIRAAWILSDCSLFLFFFLVRAVSI